MKLRSIVHAIWLLLIPIIVSIMVIDLQYAFGNADTPFFLAIGAYGLFMVLSRVSSKTTIKIVLSIICLMGVLYMTTGASRSTERMGEWFYLFFLIGLGQYIVEVWHVKGKEYHEK